MWKLSLDVENKPPVKIEPPVLNEPFLRNVRPPNNIEKKKYFMILKNWLDLHEAQEKLLKEITCNIQCFSNEDQQKMVVKLFY